MNIAVDRRGAATRAQHDLKCAAEIRAHQKGWFAGLRRRVVDEGEPYALVPAVAPHEIFEAFDMLYVCNEWWSGITAARRLSAHYFDLLNAHGYHRGLPGYAALSLATALEGDSPNQPMGGLPKPAFVLYQGQEGPAARWEGVAEAFGCPAVIATLNPDPARIQHRWWDVSKRMWEDLYDTQRINCVVEGYRQVIAACERATGRKFDIDKLREVMARANAQEEAFDEVRNLIATAPKTPVSLADELAIVMTIQWHRGSQWALDAARIYRDEIKERVAAGAAICPNESIRLAWGGVGLWQNVHFYRAFEQSHGAVFVRSLYMSIAVDGYIRYGLRDPLRALASRYAGLTQEFSQPPASTEWFIHDARHYRCDGAVILPDDTKFMSIALEKAGIPTMVLHVDAVDGRSWDNDRILGEVGDFIAKRVVPNRGNT
jgi:hypothetical protein